MAATAHLSPAGAAASASVPPAPALNAYGAAFRDYTEQATARQRSVAAFYAEQHAKQTVDFVRAQHAAHLGLNRREMSIWEAAGACGCGERGAPRATRALTRRGVR